MPYVPHIIETDHFTDNNGNKYAIQGNINCKTGGVIYAITCTECKSLSYVGQTGDTLYQRMILNFSKIRTLKKDDPAAKHLLQKNHTKENLSHRNRKGTRHEIYRKVKESFWMKKLNTLESDGLNTQYER